MAKVKTAKKPKCEVKAFVACHSQGVQKLTGRKKGDPVFWCCMGCRAWLRRNGVKVKEV